MKTQTEKRRTTFETNIIKYTKDEALKEKKLKDHRKLVYAADKKRKAP